MADAGLDIGTLSGKIELEDNLSAKMDLVIGKLDELEAKLNSTGDGAKDTAKGFLLAEVAMKVFEEATSVVIDTLKELTIEGSHAADIESTFEHLTGAADHLGSTLLTTAREGVRGTVTDLDLMTRVNQNLAVGLNLTDQQMATVTKGAFALAKATGGDVTSALDAVSTAMVTGRIRGVQLLTGKIDLKDAEDKFAASLGTTTDHLSTQGKQAAIQAVILERIGTASDRVGEVQTRLADKIQQAKVNWQNWEEELGTTIATSPKVIGAMDEIGGAISEAFGPDRKNGIEAISGAVSDLVGWAGAIGALVVKFHGVIEVLAVLIGTYAGLRLAVSGFSSVVSLIGSGAALAATPLGALALAIGAVFAAYKVGETQPVSDFFEKLGLRVQGYSGAEADAIIKTEHLNMAQMDQAETAKKAEEATKKGEEATASANDELDRSKLVIDETAAELKKYNEAWKDIHSVGETTKVTLRDVSQEVQASVVHLLAAGVSAEKLATAYKLTTEQVKALEIVQKSHNATLKLQEETLGIIAKMHDSSADTWIAVEQRKFDATVKLLYDEGKITLEQFTAELDKHNAMIDAEMQKREEQDQYSRAHFQKEYDDAKAHYEDVTRVFGEYTDAEIRMARHAQEEKERALDHWAQTATDDIHKVEEADAAANAKAVASAQATSAAQIAAADATAQAKLRDEGGAIGVNDTGDAGNSASPAMARTPIGKTTGDPRLDEFLHQGYSLAQATALLKAELYHYDVSRDPMFATKGPRVPGFKDGGVGDFGEGTLAMLHGKEAIVPLDKAGMGSVTNHFYVNGTAADVARKVSEEIMRTLKSSRQFGAA